MATIKAYTDLSQSKKLAEILPIESADMRYGYIAPYDYSDRMYDGGYDEIPYPNDFLIKNPNFSANEYDAELPCWSLAALLSVLPLVDFETPQLIGTSKTLYRCVYNDDLKSHAYDNPVDACTDIIIKLKERNII